MNGKQLYIRGYTGLQGKWKKKITLKDHIDHLTSLLVILLVISLMLFFVGDFNLSFEDTSLFFSILPFALILVLPSLIIHFNYFFKNKGLELFIDNNEMVLKGSGKKIKLKLKEIKKVDYYVSGSYLKKQFLFLPWDYYRHIKLSVPNDKEIIITSLLLDDFSMFLNADIKVEIHTDIYRLA